MGIPIGGNGKATVQEFIETQEAEQTARPDGAKLFTHRYDDGLAKSAAEPLAYRNQESYNPQLNKPGQGSLKDPVQSEETVSDDSLADEYESAVFQGIKKRVSDETVARNLNRAFNSGFENDIEDPALREMVLEVMAEEQEQINKKYGRSKSAPPPRNLKNNREGAQSLKENEVIKHLKGFSGFVKENGELSDEGSKTLYAIMSGNTEGNPIAKEVEAKVKAEIGSIPGDPEVMAGRIGMEFEEAFEKQISHLPPQEQKRMNYLLNKDPNHPDVEKFIENATSQIQGKWGENVKFATENQSYNYAINGDYQLLLDKLINQKIPLSDQAKVRAYLNAKGKGEGPTLSEGLKTLADKIRADALHEVQEMYGAPKTWRPDSSISLNDFYNSSMGMVYKSSLEGYQAMEARVEQLPEGPEKSMVANLMKKISQALSDLKQLLFQIAASDASQSSDMTRGQLDLVKTKQLKLEAKVESRKAERAEQKKLEQEQADEAERQKWMVPLMIAVTIVVTLIAIGITLATLGAASPLAGVLIAMMVTICLLSIIPSGQTDDAGKSLSLMGFLMSGLNKGIDEFTNEVITQSMKGASAKEIEQAKLIMGTLLRVAIIVGVIAGACFTGQPQIAIMLIATFVMESGFVERIISDSVKAAGGDDPPAWVALIVQVALIAVGILLAIASKGKGLTKIFQNTKALSGASQKLGTAARSGNKAADIAAKAQEKAIRAATAQKGQFQLSAKNLTRLQRTLHATEGVAVGLQTGVMVTQAAAQFRMAEIKDKIADRVREGAALDANIEEIQAMIKLLQKMVDILFGHMDDATEWAQAIGEQMDTQWGSLTEMMTNLHTAQ